MVCLEAVFLLAEKRKAKKVRCADRVYMCSGETGSQQVRELILLVRIMHKPPPSFEVIFLFQRTGLDQNLPVDMLK